MRITRLDAGKTTVACRTVTRKTIVNQPHSHYSIERIEVVSMRMPKGTAATNPQLRSAIREEFTYGCSCDHDCCGHWFGYPGQIHIKGRNVTFVIRSQRNY